ncbi:MAG: oligosaccharide flippase family protein [Gemmatimonadota bacterium]|nr:MAG: oligosaccharide flippase family protein [Gemmatimonadota bacterium]
MLEDVKTLTKHTITYGIGGIANGLVRLALIPLISRYISPVSFGVYSLLLMTISFLFLFFDFGLSYALMRWHNEYDDEKNRSKAVGTALTSMISIGIVLTVVALFLSSFLSYFLFRTVQYAHLVRIAVSIALFGSFFQLLLSILRASAKSRIFVLFTSIRGLSNVILTFTFVISMSLGISGLLWGALLSFCLGTGAFLLLFRPRFTFTLKIAKGMFGFGLPLMPSNLALWILTYADIYILKRLTGLQEVGLYQYAMEICAVIPLMLISFERAWPQFVFSKYKSEGAPVLFQRVFLIFFTVLSFTGIGLILFRAEVLSVLAAGAYHESTRVIPLLVCSGILYGAYYVFTTGLLVSGKTAFLPVITLCAVIINVSLNLVLIPKYGIVGAGFATVATNCAMATATLLLSNRYYFMSFQWLKILIIGCAGAGMYALDSFISIPIILKVLLLICVGIFLYLYVVSGLLGESEHRWSIFQRG